MQRHQTANGGSLPGRLARTGGGCLVYIAAFVALAFGIDAWLGPSLVEGAGLWVAFASSAFLTTGGGAAWGLLTGYAGGNARKQVLADAQSAQFPARDGPILATGTVRPAGGTLRAPISGRECVAYAYRMYYVTREAGGPTMTGSQARRDVVPVYWGQASRPFLVDSGRRVVRVNAIPLFADPAQRREDPDDVERARQYVSTVLFATAHGPIGLLGTAFQSFADFMTDDDAESRRDWMRGEGGRDPAGLILEEWALPPGVTACVVGPWSAAQRAIVPHVDAAETLGASVSLGPPEPLLASRGGLRPTAASAVVTAVAMFAIGAGILWGAARFLAA